MQPASLLLALLAASTQAAADNALTTLPAKIVVQLPAGASLHLDDFRSNQTGTQRHFETPPLQIGHAYAYELKMELRRGEKVHKIRRTVEVKPGETATVILEDPEPQAAEEAAAGTVTTTSFRLSEAEQSLLDLTNQQRAAAGLAPLRPNPLLFRAARAHSENMAAARQLSHFLGGGVGSRLHAVGYGWSGCGENIAAGQTSPEEAVRSWMGSPGHRANIMGGYTEVGLAVSGTYWTQIFAR